MNALAQKWDWRKSFVAFPLECVPTGVSLPFPIYLSISGPAVQFQPVDRSLHPVRAASLAQKIDCVYLPKSAWSDARRFFRQAHGLGANLETARTFLYVELKDVQERMELFPEALAHFRDLSMQVGPRLASLTPAIFQTWIRRFQDPSLYFLSHCVNVAALTARLSAGPADVAFLAGLLLNCGEIALPREIFEKNGPLDARELRQMQQHPALGAKILQSANLPLEIVRACAEHHERGDGSGYPNRLSMAQLSPLGRVAAVADVFDAMQSQRAHAPAQSLTEALRFLRAAKQQFELAAVGSLERLAP